MYFEILNRRVHWCYVIILLPITDNSSEVYAMKESVSKITMPPEIVKFLEALLVCQSLALTSRPVVVFNSNGIHWWMPK